MSKTFSLLKQAVLQLDYLIETYPEAALTQQEYNQNPSGTFAPRVIAVYGDSLLRSYIIKRFLEHCSGFPSGVCSSHIIQDVCERCTSNAALQKYLVFMAMIADDVQKDTSIKCAISAVKQNERALGTFLECLIGMVSMDGLRTAYQDLDEESYNVQAGCKHVLETIYLLNIDGENNFLDAIREHRSEQAFIQGDDVYFHYQRSTLIE